MSKKPGKKQKKKKNVSKTGNIQIGKTAPLCVQDLSEDPSENHVSLVDVKLASKESEAADQSSQKINFTKICLVCSKVIYHFLFCIFLVSCLIFLFHFRFS